jgi:LacI family transcriptional regulator
MELPVTLSRVLVCSVRSQVLLKESRQHSFVSTRQKTNRLRMKDIARDLKVSAITVSKALRGHDEISPATRDRVLQRIRELGYEPNLAARSLATGRSFIVGLIVPDLVHPFFGEIAKAISQVLRSKGYSLLISSSEEDPDLERAELDALLARQVDAILLATIFTSATQPGNPFERIAGNKVPLVLLDRAVPGLRAAFVGVNDEEVGFVAARHLLDRGCRRIAHLGGPDISTGRGRFDGYRRAIESADLRVCPDYVIRIPSADSRSAENGYEATQRLLGLDPRPDGIFCFNDEAATGALRAILDGGLRIPEDVAVIGVGNMTNTDFLKVPLTTIDQNSFEMGRNAALIALELIATRRVQTHSDAKLVPIRLIERTSTSRADEPGAGYKR